MCAHVPIQLPTKQMMHQILLGGSWLTLGVECPMPGLPWYRTDSENEDVLQDSEVNRSHFYLEETQHL